MQGERRVDGRLDATVQLALGIDDLRCHCLTPLLKFLIEGGRCLVEARAGTTSAASPADGAAVEGVTNAGRVALTPWSPGEGCNCSFYRMSTTAHECLPSHRLPANRAGYGPSWAKGL
ncbi:hypothetical protein GCM10023079_33560 [Streptomyces chitinivorans]